MKSLSVSIVVYKNPPEILSKTLKSCLNSKGVSLKLFVIDNSPTDEARKLCQHPKIEYIHNTSNIGFGKAHNIALSKVIDHFKYHIVINPDVYFDPDVLEKLYDFMETDEEIGQLMPKVLDPNGSLQHLCKLLPSPYNLIMRRFLGFWKTELEKSNYRYEMRFSDYNSIMNVPFLSGCFMFFRTATLKEVGFFDERLFLYTEDTDLTRRMHRFNKTIFYPEATIYHHHAKGSYKEPKLLWHNIKSTISYFNKWGWINDSERELINRRATFQYSQNVNGRQVHERSTQESTSDLLPETYGIE